MSLAWWIASLGGIGRLRPAPGTWGSAAVLPAAWLGPLPCLALAVGFTLAGWWAVNRMKAIDDPGWVVVDEAAGQALALAALPPGASVAAVLIAFGLFRAADIVKPGPVGWVDRQRGAFAVMADDLVAGALAGAALWLLAAVGGLP